MTRWDVVPPRVGGCEMPLCGRLAQFRGTNSLGTHTVCRAHFEMARAIQAPPALKLCSDCHATERPVSSTQWGILCDACAGARRRLQEDAQCRREAHLAAVLKNQRKAQQAAARAKKREAELDARFREDNKRSAAARAAEVRAELSEYRSVPVRTVEELPRENVLRLLPRGLSPVDAYVANRIALRRREERAKWD